MVPPDTDFEGLPSGIRNHVKVDIFIEGYVREMDLVIEEGDPAVTIHGASLPETEDIFGGSVGFGEGEQTEEAVA